MAYVPPALRRKQNATIQGENRQIEPALAAPLPTVRSIKDIQKHFWPNWTPRHANYLRNLRNDHNEANAIDLDLPKPSDDTVSYNTTSWDRDAMNADKQSTKSLAENDSLGVDDRHAEDSQQAQDSANASYGHSSRTKIVSAGDPSTSLSSDSKTQADEQQRLNKHDTPQFNIDRGSDVHELESVHPHNTLNSTEKTPHQLRYVLLFKDANPRWQADQILYVKSALELLPAEKQNPHVEGQSELAQPILKEILVFEQENHARSSTGSMFKFIGYFNLIKMDILEPHSPGLIRMQEQKWTRKNKYGRSRAIDRDASSWNKSLSVKWAVLKLKEDQATTKALGAPDIAISPAVQPDSGKEKKSVNELLREMRLNNES